MGTGRCAGFGSLFAEPLGLAEPVPASDREEVVAGFAVERHADVAYRAGGGADAGRHRLDVYRPKGRADFPVVFFVHGGSWRSGDKDLYAPLGESLARAGIGVVVCNYRLSPAVRHPAHVEDVARAFAWTCENIAGYGGRADGLFLCGHSAGAHLVALLATDPTYLKAAGRSPDDIRGVVAISGVYQVLPFGPLQEVFGGDFGVCMKASPLTHAAGKHPPFLIAHADSDLPLLDLLAGEMHRALGQGGTPSELLVCRGRDHISIITGFVDSDDPLNRAVRGFVQARVK